MTHQSAKRMYRYVGTDRFLNIGNALIKADKQGNAASLYIYVCIYKKSSYLIMQICCITVFDSACVRAWKFLTYY